MSTRQSIAHVFAVLLLILILGGTASAGPLSAPLGTSFTYQGRLTDGGALANGTYDFDFRLYDALSGGSLVGSPVTLGSVAVTNGLFTVQLDFGDVFDGTALFLQIGVRPGGSFFYVALNPRQPLTAAPYALALPGLYTQPNATSPNIIGGYSGNVISPTVVGGTIGGGGSSGFENRVQANYATVGGGDGNTAGGSYDTVGGGYLNSTSNEVSTVSGGYHNTANGYIATVGGGDHNTASAAEATVGGGESNTASGFRATISGGGYNTASYTYVTVGGGFSNTASDYGATVSGGYRNTASASSATVGGGNNNTASYYATVPGGAYNTAVGTYSLAAGNRAKANHYGAFVWGDSTDADFASTGPDQFLIRANGGVGINGATFVTSTIALQVNKGNILVRGKDDFAVPEAEATLYLGDASHYIKSVANSGVRIGTFSQGDVISILQSNGNVGIGVANPGARLDVNGIIRVASLGAAGITPLCRNASNQIADCSSSLRYKSNVASLDLGLDTVTQLRPVTFDWTGTGEPDLGFVAEEVDQVTPLLTTRNADGQIEGVKYDRISAVLVKAVQEQQQLITAQQQEITNLQVRLANLDPNSPPAGFNLFNTLSVLAFGGVAVLWIQQRRSSGGRS